MVPLLPVIALSIPTVTGHELGVLIAQADRELPADLRERPMDSLRVDVDGNSDDQNLVASVATRLFRLIRSLTNQWWITRSADAMLGNGLIRHSLAVDSLGLVIELPVSEASRAALSGDERPLDLATWNNALDALAAGLDADEPLALLHDARYFAHLEDVKPALFNCALACEISKNRAAEGIWKRSKEGRFRIGKVFSGYDLPQHLSAQLDAFAARSLEREHLATFQEIERLWDARGRIAHGGPAAFLHEGQLISVNGARVLQFERAAFHCIAWIQSL
jgi:hypothetical protein